MVITRREKLPCGCIAEVITDMIGEHGGGGIDFCPLHAAAPKMLAALEKVKREHALVLGGLAERDRVYYKKRSVVSGVQAALAAARGK